MAYEEVTQRGWFSRIGESIKGILVGLVFLLLALGLQFWNEGRTVERERVLVEGRAQVTEVATDQPDAANDGRLVRVSGNATAGDPLLDETFGVERQALALRRNVEMFQWREKKDTSKENQAGGGTREVTRYTYEQVWRDEAIDSSAFKEAAAHLNPEGMPYSDEAWRAADISIGGFRLGDDAAADIGGWDAIAPTDVALPENLAASFRANGDWLTTSEAPASPQTGDLRVQFEEIPEGPLTVIARQQDGVLGTWQNSRGNDLLLTQRGDHSAKELFDDAASTNSKAAWAIRVGGFVLAWFGFMLLLKPLSVLADVLPFLGRLVGFGLAIISGIFAAVLSFIAIGGGWLWNRPWLLGLVIVMIVGGIVWLVMRKKSGAGTLPPAPPSAMPPPPPR